MLNILKRAAIWLHLYYIAIAIAGQKECLAMVADINYLYRIERALAANLREQTRLRAEYNATFPVGVRMTWAA